MRALESAIWTSGEPVSFSDRLYPAISLPLTSVSSAKPSADYTWTRLVDAFDRAIRAWIERCAPVARTVDDDRVRMPQRVVAGRQQLDRRATSRYVACRWIVGLDAHLAAVWSDADPRSRHRRGWIETVVHDVDQDLGLKLRLAVAPHRSVQEPWPPFARGHRRDERVPGALLRLQPVGVIRVEAEVAAAVLQQHSRPLGDDAGAEVERDALDERDKVSVLVRRTQIDGVAAVGYLGGDQVGNRSEVGVGDAVADAVGGVAGRPEHLDEPRARLELGLGPFTQHLQQVEGDETLCWRRQFVDHDVAIRQRHRLDPLRTMAGQVLGGDKPVAPGDRGSDGSSDLASIEAIEAVAGDVLQNRCEVRVAEHHARVHRRIKRVRGRLAAEQPRGALQCVG